MVASRGCHTAAVDYVEEDAAKKARALSVADLIERLSAVDPTLKVQIEGCDCSGWALGCMVETEANALGGPYFYITRVDAD